jgi:hypothetical protein
VYNRPEYDRMFLRDAATGRKIFVYPTFPGFDPAFTADIQSNGGRNDIVTVRSHGGKRLQTHACCYLHFPRPHRKHNGSRPLGRT